METSSIQRPSAAIFLRVNKASDWLTKRTSVVSLALATRKLDIRESIIKTVTQFPQVCGRTNDDYGRHDQAGLPFRFHPNQTMLRDDVGAPYSLRERPVGVYVSTPTDTRYRPREPMGMNTIVTIHGLSVDRGRAHEADTMESELYGFWRSRRMTICRLVAGPRRTRCICSRRAARLSERARVWETAWWVWSFV